MKDVMVVTRPYRDDNGQIKTEVIYRCMKCGNNMVEEEFEVVCKTCDNRASCCDGEG